MSGGTIRCNGKPRRDDEVREHVAHEWDKVDMVWSRTSYGREVPPPPALAHCGGRGLVVGCPICGKRWPR